MKAPALDATRFASSLGLFPGVNKLNQTETDVLARSKGGTKRGNVVSCTLEVVLDR